MTKTIKIATLTHLTGEVKEQTFKRKTKNRAGFIMVYKSAFEVTGALAKANDCYSIVAYLAIIESLIPDSNIVKTSTMELSLKANYAQRNIGRTLDVLQSIGAILHSKIEKTNFIQIIVNPKHVFNGSGIRAEIAQDVWNEQWKNFLQKKEMYIKD